jgi:excisionase family DNA binding protein
LESNDRVLLSIPEAASALSVGRTTIYELLADGSLDAVKLGKRRLIVRASIEALVKRLAEKAAA